MTFATSTANGTKYTITLAASRDRHDNVDVAHTIERFRKLVGADAVFSIVEATKNA